MYSLIIVEDETKIRECIMNLFPWESTGFSIEGGFADGKQALDYLLNNPVDVVLTDVRMPNMDGISLAKEIRRSGLPVTVVFLSAYQDFEYLHQAILTGVKDYLVKPVKYDELIACFTHVRQHLDEARAVSGETEGASYYQQIIRTAKQFVDENLKTVTLGSAAARVSLSPNYLSRLFKDHAGQSFTDYLTEARMKKAAQLLRGIDYKSCEISEIVGYNSPKNFSRAFRNYYNMSPKEYREQK